MERDHHGKEMTSELPLVHVDSMSAVVNLSSALGARLEFHSLTLDHPVVHVILYPDGSTNQPTPKQQAAADLTQLFSTSIDRLELRRGELLMQDRQVPFEFVSNDVSARLNYSFLHRRYSGDAAVVIPSTNKGVTRMRPNLSVEKIAGALAALGTAALISACGGGDTKPPVNANEVAFTDYGYVHLSTDGGASWRQAYVSPADQNPAGVPTKQWNTKRTRRTNGSSNATVSAKQSPR